MNDDILWKIDGEIGKDKKVVELNRIITKLEEDNSCLRKALKTYEEGRYQEHLENEQLHSIIKEIIEEDKKIENLYYMGEDKTDKLIMIRDKINEIIDYLNNKEK